MIDKDTPTLFLPGTQCDERVWMPVWRSVEFSQRAYVPLQWAESIEQMLALTQDRIDSFSGKVHMIGYSMGGYIASLGALKNPQRIARLTLIGYNPRGLTSGEMKRREELIKTLNKHPRLGFSVARLKQFLTDTELQDDEVVNLLKQMDADLGSSVLKAHIEATTPRRDLTSELSKCAFPIHFICAQHDQIANANAINAYSNDLANSQFNQIMGTAHMLLLTKPKSVATKILESDTFFN